jgi:FKBP-type peptidyl-prolyl cis-trans isomerase
MMLRRVCASLTVAATLVFAGCLESSGPGDAVPIEDTNFASSLDVNLSQSTRTTNGVYYRDLVVGTGAVVANGQTLDVKYTGWLSSGFQFDSNVNEGTPYSFVLGTGNVIAGWHDGLQGARVGTTRQLIIPASMAYGPGGNGPIPGNAVIVFRVEIVGAR